MSTTRIETKPVADEAVILTETDGGVGIIRLNRPKVLNASRRKRIAAGSGQGARPAPVKPQAAVTQPATRPADRLAAPRRVPAREPPEKVRASRPSEVHPRGRP